MAPQLSSLRQARLHCYHPQTIDSGTHEQAAASRKRSKPTSHHSNNTSSAGMTPSKYVPGDLMSTFRILKPHIMTRRKTTSSSGTKTSHTNDRFETHPRIDHLRLPRGPGAFFSLLFSASFASNSRCSVSRALRRASEGSSSAYRSPASANASLRSS